MSTYRTPPSLSWLLDNRRRIAGHIQKIEGKLAKFASKYAHAKIIVDQHDIHLPRLLRSLRADLKALDQTIGLHQIAVDIDSIRPLREHAPQPRYGNMTPTIYECFSLDPRRWMTTNEITTFVSSRRCPNISEYQLVEYREAVRRHLRLMEKRSYVERIAAKGLWRESLWRCCNPRVVTGLTIHDADGPVHRDEPGLSSSSSLGNNPETTETDLPEKCDESVPQNAA